MLKQFRVPDEIAVRVESGAMRQTVGEIFEALGMPPDDRQRCVDCLLYADDRGIDSHGVSNMMRYYVDGLRDGSINPTPKMKVLREARAAATVDSDRGLGLTIGPQAMAIAIEKARQCGVGTVVANNGRHFGAAAYHAQLALPHDMIGLSMTVGGLALTPTFGAEARVGLNPLAVAVPAGVEPPFIFDASMSSVAGNKIRLAQRLGEDILPGWVAEADGTPIMEEQATPEDFLILPLGGTREIGSHKGYSLAVMIDILSGLLPGAGPALQRTNGGGHHFTVYDISAFTDVDEFKSGMDRYLRALQETPTAPGHDRVLYAGLEEHEEEIDRRERGIPYHPEVVEWFRETTSELGLVDRLG
ncbi:MAG: Ldh family oxidoreductase [Chloroflexi bacterium]|nr:Ldh family oxidoreductase [Chloroflexota bacterium]